MIWRENLYKIKLFASYPPKNSFFLKLKLSDFSVKPDIFGLNTPRQGGGGRGVFKPNTPMPRQGGFTIYTPTS